MGSQQPTGQVLPEGRGCRELSGVRVQWPLDLTSEQGGVGALVRTGGADLTVQLPAILRLCVFHDSIRWGQNKGVPSLAKIP